MAQTLAEYFNYVYASDVHDYGAQRQGIQDFLMYGAHPPKPFRKRLEWIITNPPFSLGMDFVLNMLDRASCGAAVLVRTAFLEGKLRHSELFTRYPPHTVAQFVERVAIVKGRVDEDASSATAYCWIVWRTDELRVLPLPELKTRFVWIPPCRTKLEREGDYA